MVVVKKKLLSIIRKTKKWERDRYKLMTVEERKNKIKKSWDR